MNGVTPVHENLQHPGIDPNCCKSKMEEEMTPPSSTDPSFRSQITKINKLVFI